MIIRHTVIWRSVSDPPADQQICHIRGERDLVRTNQTYIAASGAWVNQFEDYTNHSGANGVKAWIPADELDVDEGMPE